MPGPINAGLYHEQVRNLFSGGSHAATNSPLFFMERMATSTEKLLREQDSTNRLVLKKMDEHTKLLKKLAGNTGDSLGITDLIVARYLPKVLTRILGVGAFIGGGVGSILLGTKGKIVGVLQRGLRMLNTGVAGLFKSGGAIVGRITNFLGKGMHLIRNVTRPLTNLIGRMSNLFVGGGLISKAAQIGNKMMKYVPMLKGGLGKLMLPITAMFMLIDGVQGFMDANKELTGNKGAVNLFRKIQHAHNTMIDGFFLGIPNYITQKLTNKTFAQKMDETWLKLGRTYKLMGNEVANGLSRMFESTRENLKSLWNKLPSRDDWATFGTEIRDTIFGLGGYIASGVKSLVDDIKGWFSNLFSWRPWSTTPAPSVGPAPSPPNLPNQPRWERFGGRSTPTPPQTRTAPGRSGRIGGRTPIEVPMPSASGIRRPINLVPNATPSVVNTVLRNVAPNSASEIERMPAAAKNIIKDGVSALVSSGAAVVSTATKTVGDAAQAVGDYGEEMGKTLAEAATDSFKAVMEKTETARALAASMSAATADMVKSMMNTLSTGLPVLTDILTGNAQQIDAGALANGGRSTWTPGLNPSTPGYTTPSYPSAPANQTPGAVDSGQPHWWTPEFIGPLGAMPRKGSVPQSVIDSYKTGDAAVSSATSIASTMMNDMIKVGASPKFAAAIVGNMYQENGKRDKFSTTQLGDNGSAVGTMQWRGQRRRNLEAFARDKGMDPYDRKLQAMFAVEESDPNSPYADYGSVKARKLIENNPNMTVGEAAVAFSNLAERPNPAYANNPTRANAAERFFKEHQAGVSTSTPKEAYSNTTNEAYRTSRIVNQTQGNAAAIRKLEITPTLQSNMADTILRTLGPDYYADVFSGGQAYKGTGGPRIGSVRHDGGKAGDVYLRRRDGKTVSEDEYARVAQAWLAEGRGSIGFRMKGGGMHIDEHTDRAKFWDYPGKYSPSEKAMERIKMGLAGSAPNFVMTKEQAAAYLAGGQNVLNPGRAALSNSPMSGSLDKSPRSRQPSTTSTEMFAESRVGILRSRNRTMDYLNRSGIGKYDNLLGRTDMLGDQAVKEPSIAMRPPERPRSLTPPTAIKTNPPQQAKQPMTPADPNIKADMSKMPSIESIPVVDELKMLTINSESLN